MRADVSLEEASLISDHFGTFGDLSGLILGMGAGGGSGEQLSTARVLRWLVESWAPARGGTVCVREAESDCDRK